LQPPSSPLGCRPSSLSELAVFRGIVLVDGASSKALLIIVIGATIWVVLVATVFSVVLARLN
jgi:hypothetical protein